MITSHKLNQHQHQHLKDALAIQKTAKKCGANPEEVVAAGLGLLITSSLQPPLVGLMMPVVIDLAWPWPILYLQDKQQSER